MLPSQTTQTTPGRVGNYQHTSSGKKYWPFDPRPEELDINVIAHHLATSGRWAGATQHRVHQNRIFYSVAEHSVYCSWFVEFILMKPQFALEALLHDAQEGYIGDLIRPLKYSAEFKAPFKRVEDLNEVCVAAAFNLQYPFPPEVKTADEAVCTAEANQIVPKDPAEDWEIGRLHDDSIVAPYPIVMLEPYKAKEFFLTRYKEVLKNRAQFRALPMQHLL